MFVKKEITLSTAKEMFKFKEAVDTHSEYTTDFEGFCNKVCESFERCFVYYDCGTPTIDYNFLDEGKVKVSLTYYAWHDSTIEGEIEKLVKEDLHIILKNVVSYIENKMKE